MIAGCKENMVNNNNNPRVWYTTGAKGYLQSLLTLNSGPVPLQNTIRNYDFIEGISLKGNWAFIASHLIHKLPDSIKKDLKQYKPPENKNSMLTYSEIIFDKKISIETLQINDDDDLYKRCILESKKQLLANFNGLVKVSPLDHHLSMYRIRFEKDTFFFDLGPYTDDNLYEGFENIIEMNIGCRYSDDNQVFYSRNKIKKFNIDTTVINSFQDNLRLQDSMSKEVIGFKYVSFPFTVNLSKGSNNCEINKNQIKITYESDKSIVLVARILVTYRDYKRSGMLFSLGKEWIESHKTLSNIKDLNKPLVELYLETDLLN